MGYKTLEEIMNEKGISPSELSRETGVSKSTLSGWKNGSYEPKVDKLMAIAKYLGVPVEIFIEEDWDKNIESRISFYNEKIAQCPLYHVAAGEGAFNDIYPDEYKDCESDDEYCWCKVEGDSMYPFLMDGDQIRVELTTDICQSDFTVVKVDGEHATVKHVEITKDGVWLRAINKEVYEDHFYSTHEVMTLPVTIVGKVVRMERHL